MLLRPRGSDECPGCGADKAKLAKYCRRCALHIRYPNHHHRQHETGRRCEMWVMVFGRMFKI